MKWLRYVSTGCGLLMLLLSPAYAAPHLAGIPEPRHDDVGSFRNEQFAARALLAPGLTGLPPATVRMVLLRVDFLPEYDPATTAADPVPTTTGSGVWSDPLYAFNGSSDYWVEKNRVALIDYFTAISRGKLNLTVEVSPQVYRLPRTVGAYGSETSAAIEALIGDAVSAALAGGVDLVKPATSDAQIIVIVHAGPGEETDTFRNPNQTIGNTPGDIWSLYATYSGAVTIAGVPLKEAIIMPQSGGQDGVTVDPLGVYAHEFGHFLGLPDLYPTNSAPLWGGVGSWCLMDSGAYTGNPVGSNPAWPSAWCRLYLGWETATAPAPTADLGMTTFMPAERSDASGERLVLLPVAPGVSDRYFLMENRQPLGSDAGLDGHGLLVWRVDEAVLGRNLQTNTINNSRAEPGISVIEADGDGSLLSVGGFADDGDPFPGTSGKLQFTPYSTPVRSLTAFGSGWVNLTDISEDGLNRTITADVGLGPVDVQGLTKRYSAGSVLLAWEANPDVSAYTIYRNGVEIGTTAGTNWSDPEGREADVYGIASVDRNGNVTLPRAALSSGVTSSSGGSNDGGCFIATAAYGSYEAPAVQLLRTFRDRILLGSAPGRAFVRFYYKVSPPLAQTIADSPWLRALARLFLLPPIALAAFCVLLSPAQQLGCVVLLLAAGLALFRRVRRSNRATDEIAV